MIQILISFLHKPLIRKLGVHFIFGIFVVIGTNLFTRIQIVLANKAKRKKRNGSLFLDRNHLWYELINELKQTKIK